MLKIYLYILYSLKNLKTVLLNKGIFEAAGLIQKVEFKPAF